MAPETSNKVLIIGAGLAGLTLAQILWANDVPFEIFERDAGPKSRKQGWAVALVECLPSLRELLPKDLRDKLNTNSVNHNVGTPDEISFIDLLTGERVGQLGGVPIGEPGSVLRVSRENFRSFLWNEQKLPISTEKYFTHYEQDAEGVTAFFKDGTNVRGRLLIGADGAHSHTLDQLIGGMHHKPVLSSQVPIAGVVTLPPALYEPIRKWGNAVCLGSAPGVRMQIGTLDIEPDWSHATYFWQVMLPRDEPKELSDWVQTASKQEIYDLCVKSTSDLHPTVKDMISFGGPEAISETQLRFLEYAPPDTLPSGRVVMVGDAAHAMIPYRGAGANTALLDACDLARLLIKSFQQGKDPIEVIESYNNVMIPRGRDNVRSSHAAGEASEHVQDWAQLFRRH